MSRIFNKLPRTVEKFVYVENVFDLNKDTKLNKILRFILKKFDIPLFNQIKRVQKFELINTDDTSISEKIYKAFLEYYNYTGHKPTVVFIGTDEYYSLTEELIYTERLQYGFNNNVYCHNMLVVLTPWIEGYFCTNMDNIDAKNTLS